MRRCLLALVVLSGVAVWSPTHALESGATCDIADDAVQPDVLKDLERILKELATKRTS